MTMGLLADPGYRWNNKVSFASQHRASLMGGNLFSYPSYQYGFPPGYSPALTHSRQGFSLSADNYVPYYSHTSAAGDRVEFSAEAGFYRPRY
jgi:hypothetical protein